MQIEFFNTKTGTVYTQEQSNNMDLFVMGNMVLQNNFQTCESQSSVVDFYSFCDHRDDIDWRVIE